MASPVYGETNAKLKYQVCDLLWRPARRLVRFVAVIHPSRGRILLMCTDLNLSAADIIRLYGLRFKIEHTFKQAVNQIGTLAYHFWMQKMKPLRRRNGNQYMHREPLDYRTLTAVRAGHGLLTGLLRRGRCGRKLHIRYWGKRGTAARYLCQGDFGSGGKYCLGFGGATVDQRVSDAP